MGRYAETVVRIINAYPAGIGLVTALETYISSCVERAHDQGIVDARSEEAALTCEHLHDGPPKGLVCRACYEAVVLAPYAMQVQADMEIAAKKKNGE